MLRYVLFRLLSLVVPHVREAMGYRFAGWLGTALYLASPHTRALVHRNLRQVLGAPATRREVRRLGVLVFRNLLWNYYEMFHLPTYSREELRCRLHVQGAEHAEEVLRQGGSAILVFPHIGNLEMLLQVAVQYPQYHLFALVERMQNDRVFHLMRRLRGSQGLRIVAATDVVRITRLLRDGWSVILAGDFDSTGSGIMVDFFGEPARMPDGAVRLARSTGAPLLVAYGWRDPTDPVRASKGRQWVRPRHHLQIMPPEPMSRTADPRADAQRGVERLLRTLEPLIAAHLDQWLAVHPFWAEETW